MINIFLHPLTPLAAFAIGILVAAFFDR